MVNNTAAEMFYFISHFTEHTLRFLTRLINCGRRMEDNNKRNMALNYD